MASHDKNFSLHNMLCTTFFYFPKSIGKNFENFSFEHFNTLTLVFQCLKLAIVKVLLLPELLASALLFTFVENELSLEPSLFRNFFTFGSHTRQCWSTTH